MVLCRVLVGDKRYCAYVLIYDKFEPFERFEPLLGPFERFKRYMSTSLYRPVDMGGYRQLAGEFMGPSFLSRPLCGDHQDMR